MIFYKSVLTKLDYVYVCYNFNFVFSLWTNKLPCWILSAIIKQINAAEHLLMGQNMLIFFR